MIKQRHYPMLGFAGFELTNRFCNAFYELRDYFKGLVRGW